MRGITMQLKKWYLSRTMWVAVLTFISGGLMALETQYPALGWAVMLKAVIDMALRLDTSCRVY